MRKLVCLLLVNAMLLGSCLFVGNAHASTSVGGLIGSDTTWDAANSPYQLTAAIGVENGVTLTIDAGVTVDFAGNYIEVNGTLNAEGTISNNIVFTSTVSPNSQASSNYSITQYQVIEFDSPSSGGIIANATFNIVALWVEDGAPEIIGNTFNNPGTNAVDIQGGSPSILNNIINSGSTGVVAVVAKDHAEVSNNLVDAVGSETYAVYAQDYANISNNLIEGGGISVSLYGAATFIENTVVDGSGILSESSVTIQQNYIANDTCGINGGGTIESNTIIDNKVGIEPSSATIILNNNICGNTQNNIYLTTASNVNATDNWWGTTDAQAINQTIFDFKNDFTLGVVTFIPFLTQPSSTAPSAPISSPTDITPNNTQTPTVNPQSTLPLNQSSSPTQSPRPLSTQSLNQIVNPLSSSDLTQIVTMAVVIISSMVVAVLIILTIRKRTLPQKAARKTKKKKRARKPDTP